MSDTFTIGAPPKEERKRKRYGADQQPGKPVTPKPLPKNERLLAHFQNTNPIYAMKTIKKYLTKTQTFAPGLATRPGEIRILFPQNPKTADLNDMACSRASKFRGSLLEWHVYLQEMYVDSDVFPNNQIIKTNNFVSEFNGSIPYIAYRIFLQNQTLRWRFKRLVSVWLSRKCSKRILGADSDIITMEPIQTKDQIRIVCLSTRSTYVYSGSALIRSVLSNLETQVEAIPDPKPPVNPLTNLAFTYSQMLELYHELVGWCAVHRRPFPTLLSLYKESNFNSEVLSKIHHNYLQYKASKNYFAREESDDDFFIENLSNVFDAYKPLKERKEWHLVDVSKFRMWLKLDPGNYILAQWKMFVSDYWYYVQTDQFPRESWNSENSIMMDVKALLAVSRTRLETIKTEYIKKFPRAIHDVEESDYEMNIVVYLNGENQIREALMAQLLLNQIIA
jgi:hypothetical protein